MVFDKRIVQYNFKVFVLWVTSLRVAHNTAVQHLLCNICKGYVCTYQGPKLRTLHSIITLVKCIYQALF